MAQSATVSSLQTIQFDVPGSSDAEGTTRVHVTTGIAHFDVRVTSPLGGGEVTQTTGLKFFVEPVIDPGRFRKASAIVALGSGMSVNAPAGGSGRYGYAIDEIAASLDDESGRVEVRFEITVSLQGPGITLSLSKATFQVTTIAGV